MLAAENVTFAYAESLVQECSLVDLTAAGRVAVQEVIRRKIPGLVLGTQ